MVGVFALVVVVNIIFALVALWSEVGHLTFADHMLLVILGVQIITHELRKRSL